MKKINYLFVLLTTTVLFITSCGKDGAPGPTGPNGSQGTTGAAGAVGATGADGTKIYSGTTAPEASVGATGDFYINVSTSGFYGPKTAAGWGSPFSLKGATGAQGLKGTDGSAILSGNAAPAASLGVDGDYFLNKVTYAFYGPKVSGTWPAPVSLKGPKGDTGTANVIYSDWITPPTYTKTVVFGTNTLTYDIVEPKITQAILDQGAVVVYGRLNGYNTAIWPVDQVSPLPILINYLNGTTPETDTWSGLYSLGNVQISFKNNNNLYNSIATAHSFRYVIIPGSVKISSLNLKNYDELKRQLQMKN